MKNLLFIVLLLFIMISCDSQRSNDRREARDYLKTETGEEKNARMQWWRDAGFGMFIHWGLYAVPAGQYGEETNHAEWIQETANIPVKEYEKYAELFNPLKYNASEWVRMAKDAGMKYIVITSKHHDGFCLWDSKVSGYDVADRTPYKKDLLRDLADACEKEGIILCFYHSIMDWNHPYAQGANYPDYNYGKGPNPEFHKYVDEYMIPQLEELLSNYGKLGVLWFDGEWINEWTEDQGKELYNHLRNIQPDLIINNRVGKGRQGMEGMNAYEDAAGDFGTPEQGILEGTSDMDWESCMTMNNHWGYNKFDSNFKSSKVLIHNLIDIAAKGGNYLLNVGPTADGLFPQESIDRLEEIGKWMKINGEVIHNSRGTKHYREGKSIYYINNDDNKYLYAVFTEWPGNSLHLKYADPEDNSEITLLGYDNALTWEDRHLEGVRVILPDEWQSEQNRPCEHAWVIKMAGKQAKVADAPVFYIDGEEVKSKALFSDTAIVELKSSTPGSKILYTFDGTCPGKGSIVYDQPVKVNSSAIIKAISVKEGYVDSQVSKINILQSSTYKGIEYDSPYSTKYDALGDLSLGDGIFGEKENYHENWLGFEGVDFIVTFDLGYETAVSQVSVNFLQSIRSWIFFPEYLEVSSSLDGVYFSPLASLKIPKVQAADETEAHLFELTLPKTRAHYIRIYAKNIGVCPEWHTGAGGKAWLFVDEVIIK